MLSPERIQEWLELAPAIAGALTVLAGAVVKWVIPAKRFFLSWKSERDANAGAIIDRLDAIAAKLDKHSEQIDAHTAEIKAIRSGCAEHKRGSLSAVAQ